MLIGTKYRVDWDILIPDENGRWTLINYYFDENGQLDYVEVAGHKGGRPRQAWSLNDGQGKLCFRNNTPFKSYKYKRGVLEFDKNGGQRVVGTYPIFHDLNRRQVWIAYNRNFWTEPYNFERAVQVEAMERESKRAKRLLREELRIFISAVNGTTKHKWVVRVRRGKGHNKRWIDLCSGYGSYRSHCEHDAELWIENYKSKLTERYKCEQLYEPVRDV